MKSGKVLIIIILFIFLATITHLVQRQIRGKPGEEPPSDILYLPQGQYVKIIALGFDNFWADLIWIRSLQYFGGHFMYDKKYPIIDRLIEVITTLEPTFQDIYSFGAMVLHEEIGERDKAVALLDKGIKNMPQNWHLPYEKGFLWFEEMRGSNDTIYQKLAAVNALEAYSIATTRPGCPEFVSRIVTQMYFEAGYENLAVEMWKRALKEAEEKGDMIAMNIAEDKLLLIEFQEVAAPVQKAVIDYYRKFNKLPATLDELILKGFIKKIPLDPINNQPLEYNPQIGRVYSKAKPHFSPL